MTFADGRPNLQGIPAMGLPHRCGRSVHALEIVHTSVLELDPGASHEVLDGGGDEHLSLAGQSRHPCADVHRYAADVSPQELELAGMHACANLQAESLSAPGLALEGGASHESGPVPGHRVAAG
jgi:hypothetical protein